MALLVILHPKVEFLEEIAGGKLENLFEVYEGAETGLEYSLFEF